MYSHQTTRQPLASAPVARQFRPLARPQKGCIGNACPRPNIKSHALALSVPKPAFLRKAHPPKTGRPHAELKRYRKVENGFSASLSNLCTLYGLAQPKLEGLFPMNIQKAFSSLSAELEEKDRDLKLRIMQDENGRVSLATLKTFNTKTTLYYLPLDKLWELMKKRDRKPESALLLSMLSYLYQVAGVPHYCENYAYLGEIYEMVADWEAGQSEEGDQEDENYRKALEQHYSLLYSAGGILLSLMADGKNLHRFSGRVRRFRPRDETGEFLHACARGLLKLYLKFPRRSIMDRMAEPVREDTDDRVVRADQYISFYWSGNDCIIENVMEYVNCELNELCEMEEPQSIQYFDTPQSRENHNFSFEETFFCLLNDLTDILNDLQ
ncbi:hypothetical protein QWY86_16205 [Pedobacter aquatilis]|uniref:hypothetical protein n=1 Tax=Pedobacter aquatilis TaxID=351343 RepID=UPI0025B5D89F|nr:hypothetical protein [Pedobacter aquatilis]MDN3588228.1 hypothetical protein [Pedobacter aquatilis]